MEFVEIDTAVPICPRTWQTQVPLVTGIGIRSPNLLASLNLLEIQIMNHPTKRVQVFCYCRSAHHIQVDARNRPG
jgi:hypothetical protein